MKIWSVKHGLLKKLVIFSNDGHTYKYTYIEKAAEKCINAFECKRFRKIL
jgi:hypothetical protein